MEDQGLKTKDQGLKTNDQGPRTKHQGLRDLAADIYTCNRTRCGFCREECPVYRLEGYETYSCRGKMLVARGLLEGTLQPSQALADLLAACALCGYCQARCALQNVAVVEALRAEMAAAGYVIPATQASVDSLRTQGSIYGQMPEVSRRGTTPLYLGCLYRTKPQELHTALSVLERLGFDPLIAPEACCGYLAEATGFPADFAIAQARFREVYEPYLEQEILTLCPTCTITLRDRYGLRVKHALVAVAERLADPAVAAKLDRNVLAGRRATYHDPCHLGRMLGVMEEPRAALRALGIELVEMPQNRYFSACCGGGGGLTQAHPKLSVEIGKNRVREAYATGAETIITACPTCQPTLLKAASRVANEIDVFLDVLDLWELLRQALEPGDERPMTKDEASP